MEHKPTRQRGPRKAGALPPPNPLLPKTVVPSEPALHAFDIPFESSLCRSTATFSGVERKEGTGDSPVLSRCPEKFPPETRLRSLFEEDKIVYLRDPVNFREASRSGTFNSCPLDLRKALSQRTKRGPLLTGALPAFYVPTESDRTLVFESRFESGNLAGAAKLTHSEYNLLVQNDINSRGHTQWFYFKVSNTESECTVKFNIVNFAKPDSLYNSGMKVLVYSQRRVERTGEGWVRECENILYYPNGVLRELSSHKSLHTLTFRYTFPYTDDTVYFAYSLPYTYSELQGLLDNYEQDPVKSKFINRKTLCRTLGGNNCDYLTITNKGPLEEIRKKKGVVISARAHPGETVGSWVMQGVLEFLTEETEEAHSLRERYVFKVLPMLNPDGVINGNYRCSLSGADLNRRWKQPVPSLHPVVHNFKRLIKTMAGHYTMDLICDLHGHSRKKGVFIYGCDNPTEPAECRVFPYILSKISPVFSYAASRFGVQKSKERTLRISLFKELKIPNVFTLEASFCGTHLGPHFTMNTLKNVGRDLCRALVAYSAPPGGLSAESALKELNCNKEMLCNRQGSSSSGSDSEPSEDNFEPQELKKLLPGVVGPKRRVVKRRQHSSQPVRRANTSSAPKAPAPKAEEVAPHRHRPPGVRTYYNLSGRRVHDQQSQTPVEFYPKILRIRAEQPLRESNGEVPLKLH